MPHDGLTTTGSIARPLRLSTTTHRRRSLLQRQRDDDDDDDDKDAGGIASTTSQHEHLVTTARFAVYCSLLTAGPIYQPACAAPRTVSVATLP